MSTKKSKPKSKPDIKVEIKGNVQRSSIIIGNSNLIEKKSDSPKSTNVKTLSGFLPVGSYIPFPRNVLFTGRIANLENLAFVLAKREKRTNIVISQAITGMGGIGKTQLAVEFAYRHGHLFNGVHWLDLRDPSTLDSQIALCGTYMGLTHADQREQVAVTLKTWQSESPRLLILDNFEDVTKSNDVLARFQHPSLRVLVTSRRKDFPKSTGLQVQEINLFSLQESLDFLQKTLDKSGAEEEKTKLADELGNLPLALELATSYININKITISDYLKQLDNLITHESMQENWFRELDIISPTKHDLSLLGTFQLSWQEVKDETQRKIFMITGYCAPNTPIPLEIFKETLDINIQELHRDTYRLNNLGIININNDLPSIHPLLATYARTLNTTPKHLLENLVDRLTILAHNANDQMDQSGNLYYFAPYYLHIISIIKFAEKFKIQDVAKLLGSLGYYLMKIADYVGAKMNFERALIIEETSNNPDLLNIALLNGNLGQISHFTGKYHDALEYHRVALSILEKKLGSNHILVTFAISDIGSALQELGDLAGAKSSFEHVIKIRERLLGPDSPEISSVTSNLGIVLREMGDLLGAKAAHERALHISEITFGSSHPNTASYINNLGSVLRDLGDYTGAKNAYERALDIDKATFGLDHPKIANRIHNLSYIFDILNDKENAIAYEKQALKIWVKFLPPDHPHILVAKLHLKSLGVD